jgi:ADP-heptose:LPS heptosyltransferase
MFLIYIHKDPIILINPNASDLLPQRRWPKEFFAETVSRLHEKIPQALFIMTGGRSDFKDCEWVRSHSRCERSITVAGETTLRELLALYSLAKVMITNDSGPAHFASATTLPRLVLFGPETPLLYRPLSKNARCLSANLSCSPCVNAANHRKTPCLDNVCMKSISVDRVFNEVFSMLR